VVVVLSVREVTWGTPRRSRRYQAPRRHGLVPLALLLGGLAAGLFFAAVGVGARSALSPGNISSAHAPMAASCAECHADRAGVASARCERCHDPAGARNLGHAAHVAVATRATEAAAEEIACDGCHREHEGRDARIAVVSSSECAQCHFRSFSAHPEFAVMRERRGERPGLRFDHAAHLLLLVETKGRGRSAACTRCHVPSPENRDFLPLSFEAHCAECHDHDGWLGTVEGVEAGLVSAPPAGDATLERGRSLKVRVRHRDSWVVANWHALRRGVDPAGYQREARVLRARLERLQKRLAFIGQAAPGSQPPPAVLTLGARIQLERAIAEAEGRLRVVSGGPGAPEAAPLAPAAERSAAAALAAVSAPCRACHVTDSAGAFAPVRAARHVLTSAAFVHAPHLLYADCARCHAGVAQSESADELHLEGIQTCRGCHGAPGVREDCQNCHRYHPKAAW
jgi:hypothetical protein